MKNLEEELEKELSEWRARKRSIEWFKLDPDNYREYNNAYKKLLFGAGMATSSVACPEPYNRIPLLI